MTNGGEYLVIGKAKRRSYRQRDPCPKCNTYGALLTAPSEQIVKWADMVYPVKGTIIPGQKICNSCIAEVEIRSMKYRSKMDRTSMCVCCRQAVYDSPHLVISSEEETYRSLFPLYKPKSVGSLCETCHAFTKKTLEQKTERRKQQFGIDQVEEMNNEKLIEEEDSMLADVLRKGREAKRTKSSTIKKKRIASFHVKQIVMPNEKPTTQKVSANARSTILQPNLPSTSVLKPLQKKKWNLNYRS